LTNIVKRPIISTLTLFRRIAPLPIRLLANALLLGSPLYTALLARQPDQRALIVRQVPTLAIQRPDVLPRVTVEPNELRLDPKFLARAPTVATVQ